jgi:hypothetical protein
MPLPAMPGAQQQLLDAAMAAIDAAQQAAS